MILQEESSRGPEHGTIRCAALFSVLRTVSCNVETQHGLAGEWLVSQQPTIDFGCQFLQVLVDWALVGDNANI